MRRKLNRWGRGGDRRTEAGASDLRVYVPFYDIRNKMKVKTWPEFGLNVWVASLSVHIEVVWVIRMRTFEVK